MTDLPAIIFPHLHITIPEFSNSFRIFGISIAYYGLLIAVGVFLAFILSIRQAKRTGQNTSN